MATVTKTWVFASDNEELADGGNHANITLNHDTAGNPGGSMDFVTDDVALTNAIEFARASSTTPTWETWGVPAGAIVTDVQITGYDWRQWGVAARITSHGYKMRVVDSAGATVHSAGDLVATDPSTNVDHVSWQSVGAGTSRAVDAGKQASTTQVRLEVEYRITRVATGTDLCDVGFDNIELTITYEIAVIHNAPVGMFDPGIDSRAWW
jgi:hypothetical protein